MIKAVIFDCFGVLTDGSAGKNIQLLAYIGELKKAYKIGMLSNVASNWIRESFLTKEELGLFDDILLSYEAGMAKPNLKFFELACERLGTLPEETILVDDSESYCDVAEMFGMEAVLYTDFASLKKQLQPILDNPNN